MGFAVRAFRHSWRWRTGVALMVTSCLLTARTGKNTLLLLTAVPRRPCVTGEAWRDVGGTTRDGSCLSVYLPITFSIHTSILFIYLFMYTYTSGFGFDSQQQRTRPSPYFCGCPYESVRRIFRVAVVAFLLFLFLYTYMHMLPRRAAIFII